MTTLEVEVGKAVEVGGAVFNEKEDKIIIPLLLWSYVKKSLVAGYTQV